MDLIVGQMGLVVGTYLYCVGSGFIPVMNAEVYLLAVSATSSPGTLLPLVLAASLGQMTAKSVMYFAGRGVLSVPMGRASKRFEATSKKLSDSKLGPGGFMFVSGFTGLPPFYVVSILAGTIRIPYPIFLVPGGVGRFFRFAVIVLFPHLARQILP